MNYFRIEEKNVENEIAPFNGTYNVVFLLDMMRTKVLFIVYLMKS